MSIPNVSGNFPNGYFQPTLFPLKFYAKFYAASVCSMMCNTDYEDGLLSFGATVNIRQIPNVVVTPSSIGEKINWQIIQDSQVQLQINYAYDAAVIVDDIQYAQMDVDIQGAIINEMANRLRIVIETQILGSVYSSAGTTLTKQNWTTAGNPTDEITLGTAALDNNNIPTSDRYTILAPNAARLLKKEVTLYALNSGNPKGALITGYVGDYDGTSVYGSTLLTGTGATGSPYQCYIGHRVAITMATQFTNFKSGIVLQDYYGTGIRCQNLFGFVAALAGGLVAAPVQTI